MIKKKVRKIARKQISNKQREARYSQQRQELTEVQYEYLTERYVIRPSHTHYHVLDEYAHKANNIYNQALYRVRQELFDGNWMNYHQLNTSMKTSRDQKDCMLYACMNSVHLVQQILKVVTTNMTSWKKARDAYRADPEKFTGRPRLPKYRKKGGKFTLFVDAQTAKLREGSIVEIPVLDNLRIELQHVSNSSIRI